MLMRSLLKKSLLTIALLMLVVSPRMATAQNVQNIVAVVNDQVISGYDLRQRIALTIALSDFPDTEETRKQLVNPTIARLIDDALKIQEAERFNVTVGDEEVLKAIEYLERNNNMAPGQIARMLEENNIDIATLMAQIRANLTWNRLIEGRILPRIIVSDEEVAAVQARLENNKGKTEYLMSEIYIPVENAANEDQVRNGVANLIGQIRAGAPFPRVAAQISQGSTAASGGVVGWVLASEVEPEIGAALSRLRPGEVSDPIRGASGYFIIMVEQTRTILDNNPDDIALDLTQIIVPPPSGNGDAATQEKLALTVSNVIKGCSDLPPLLTELNSRDNGQIGRLRLGDLPDHIRELVKDLQPGEASEPYKDSDLYRIFVVCGRNDPQSRSNDPEEIRREIMLRRAENRARGYLQDIHNAATIETR